MKSYKDKQLLFGLLFLGLAAGLAGRFAEQIDFSFLNTNQINSATAILATQENLEPTIPLPRSVTLGFVGDIMLDRGVKAKVDKYLDGDYAKLFADAEFLKEPDILFANLEGPVSDKGTDKRNLYSFRMEPEVLTVLKDAGIDVVSFANNHIGDWRMGAFTDSLTRLRENGILACGAGMNKTEAATPTMVAKNGTTIGYLCFTDVGPNDMAATNETPGILLASDPNFDAIVASAAQKVDTLIVSFHWGVEYKTVHNAHQEALAKRAIDNGAALIAGHHPHVPQDIGVYKNAPILYSLGNFVFDQYFSEETMHGLYVTAKLEDRIISEVTPHITKLDSNFAVSLKK